MGLSFLIGSLGLPLLIIKQFFSIEKLFMEFLYNITELVMSLLHFLHMMVLGPLGYLLHLAIRLLGHLYFLIQTTLIGVLGTHHFRLNLLQLILHLIFMLFFHKLLVVETSLPLNLLKLLLITQIVLSFHIYEHQFGISALSFLVLSISEFCQFLLLCHALHFQRQCMFLSPFFY